MSRFAAVVCMMALAVPALAAEVPTRAAPAKPVTQKPKLSCTYETPTGSHFPKKICVTEEQRAERRTADQEAMRNTQNNRGAPAQPQGGR